MEKLEKNNDSSLKNLEEIEILVERGDLDLLIEESKYSDYLREIVNAVKVVPDVFKNTSFTFEEISNEVLYIRKVAILQELQEKREGILGDILKIKLSEVAESNDPKIILEKLEHALGENGPISEDVKLLRTIQHTTRWLIYAFIANYHLFPSNDTDMETMLKNLYRLRKFFNESVDTNFPHRNRAIKALFDLHQGRVFRSLGKITISNQYITDALTKYQERYNEKVINENEENNSDKRFSPEEYKKHILLTSYYIFGNCSLQRAYNNLLIDHLKISKAQIINSKMFLAQINNRVIKDEAELIHLYIIRKLTISDDKNAFSNLLIKLYKVFETEKQYTAFRKSFIFMKAEQICRVKSELNHTKGLRIANDIYEFASGKEGTGIFLGLEKLANEIPYWQIRGLENQVVTHIMIIRDLISQKNEIKKKRDQIEYFESQITKQFNQAFETGKSCYEMSDKFGFTHLKNWSLVNLAEVLMLGNRLTDAEEHIKQYLQPLSKNNRISSDDDFSNQSSQLYAAAILILAEIEILRHHASQARSYLDTFKSNESFENQWLHERFLYLQEKYQKLTSESIILTDQILAERIEVEKVKYTTLVNELRQFIYESAIRRLEIGEKPTIDNLTKRMGMARSLVAQIVKKDKGNKNKLLKSNKINNNQRNKSG